jgi:hypothetical protein
MVVKCTFTKELRRLVETWFQQGLILNQDTNNIKMEATDSRSTNKLPKDETAEHLPTFTQKKTKSSP